MPTAPRGGDGVAAQLAPPELQALLARFRVTRELGRGGMGVVYQGTLPDSQQPCALKTLRTTESRSATERLLREASLLTNVMHPHLVDIHASGMAGDLPWIALELLEGRTLKERILEGPRPAPEFLEELVRALASVLEILHGVDLVHRDVKPSNIILTPEGRAVLMDLGLALPGGKGRLTGTGLVVGTATYLAPEYLASGETGPAQDWYALGITLYETIVGAAPFSAQAVLRESLTGGWPALPEIPEELASPPLRTLVRALAEPDPAARVRDQAGVLAILEGRAPRPRPAPSQPAPAGSRDRRGVLASVGDGDSFEELAEGPLRRVELDEPPAPGGRGRVAGLLLALILLLALALAVLLPSG